MNVLDQIASSPWFVGVALLLGGFVGGRLLVLVLRPLLASLARKSAWRWDDLLVDAIATPLCLLVAVRSLDAALPWLPVDPRARDLVTSTDAIVTTGLVLWMMFRAIDVVVSVLSHRTWAIERPATRSLLAIAGRMVKVTIVILAGIVALASLGVSVASLVAGLGIGGLAVALASQKTVENLFGTLSIGVDQPLREGDFVRVGELLGTVEAIGLRSTRVRTLDRTIVTIPNGQLADLPIESLTVRDRIRLACTLGLTYATSAAQLRSVLTSVESLLRAHPKIWADDVVVRFKAFGASSLDIEVMAWFQTVDWGEFQAIRQDLLLGIMEAIAGAGAELAFPTQTIHLAPSADHVATR